MKAAAALILALASFPVGVAACSLELSGPYAPADGDRSQEPPVSAELKAVELRPNIGVDEGDSCWGVGYVAVTLTGKPFRKLESQGYLVRPLSGLHDPGLFPSGALAPKYVRRGALTITWGWTGVTPDPDGHLRWRFEVVPVSAAGIEGEPLQVCVATDDSCAPQAGGDPLPGPKVPEPALLSGRLATQRHAEHPDGGRDAVEAPVIELAEPVVFSGQTFHYVQLVLGEPDHARWRSLSGRSATVICSPLEPGTLWAHPHVQCQPRRIEPAP